MALFFLKHFLLTFKITNRTILFVFICLQLILNTFPAFAEVQPKKYTAKPLSVSINIDGAPNEAAWSSANIADNFIQLDPVEGAQATQRSEVKVLYDNNAVYFSAVLYDSHPESILHQLGNRDESGDLNSDFFRIGIDPYNIRQGGYVFEVSASGVQSESFDDNLTFDAVWESKTMLTAEGWSLEIRIPYSALRFPPKTEQLWGIQFARLIRRNREYDQWSLTPKDVSNRMLYWGTMDGINNITPPLRLSLTPYLSVYSERSPSGTDGKNTLYENSYSYSGGADIKYGINESFTLDMTLLPDFSQVQSDNKIKNLSAFETIYSENRPFFKEGTSLFSKGGLFYSRRIGKTPELFYDVSNSLKEGEVLEDNPDKVKLLNATKISGRTTKGLGIGILNAVTNNTYATIKQSNGDRKKILTEPLTNYNLFIFDQQLKNNSQIYLVNSNVMRDGKSRDANVTKGQVRLENKKHQYSLLGQYSESHIFEWEGDKKKNVSGSSYLFRADKIIGKSQYGASYEAVNKSYNKNDLSYVFYNDFSQFDCYYSYNEFNPFWKYFKQGSINFFVNRGGSISRENELVNFTSGFNFFLLFNNNWSIFADMGVSPIEGKDYYEPRIENKYYLNPTGIFGSINITTNYNKRLAFDFGGRHSHYKTVDGNDNFGYYLNPRIRFSDHFSMQISNQYDKNNDEIGFATITSSDTSVFGKRDVITLENSLTSNYIFKNDMSLSCSMRHYWSNGKYSKFYQLNTTGRLDYFTQNDLQAYDFNSNYFTIDLVYNWQFAPGSSFLVTYKNLIYSDSGNNSKNYFDNLKETFSGPQTNSISLKVLYYLDYQNLVRSKKSFDKNLK